MKIVFLLLAMLVALSAIAAAEVTIISPDNGAHSSINPQQFIFKSNVQASNCSLYLDGGVVRSVNDVSANQAALIAYELSDNLHTWSITCNSNGSFSTSAEYSMVMDTTPPVVKLQSPSNGARLNSTRAEFVYTVNDGNLKSCSLRVKIKDFWTTLQNNLSTPSGKNNTFSIDLIDDTYKWNIVCFDRVNNSGTSLFERDITVDTTPPKIVAYTPFAVITESSATLTVTTNEDASCRYSSHPNASFEAMTPFDLTELKTHRQFISGVADGINSYYVKCVDLLGNEMKEEKVKLDVHLLPTARVMLSRPSPLSSGKVDLTLNTSRELIEPPELSYSLEGGSEIAIPLTGSGAQWNGSFIIDGPQQKKIGTFKFTGKDSHGYKGTIITSGKTFIVDTLMPSAPSNFKGEFKSGHPVLTWHTFEDDVQAYEIYRSTKPGVAYTNYYTNTTLETFFDFSIVSRQTYYYRVGIVDTAGNRGALADEVFVTVPLNESLPAAVEVQSEEPKPLPPNLVIKVNDAIKSLDATSLSVKQAKSSLESLSGETKRVADDLGLVKKAESANVKLDSLIKGLESLKVKYNTENVIDDAILMASLEGKKILASLVSSVSIEEQTEFLQDIFEEDVKRASSELASTLSINPDNKDTYVKHNMQILKNFEVTTKITLVKVGFVNGKTDHITLFQKSLSYRGEAPLEDVAVIEFIPKTIAESASDIDFISSVPEILEDDPVLKWGFVELGFDAQPIKYSLPREIGFTEAKSAITVPLTDLSVLTGQTKITGFATYSLSTGTSLTAIILIASVVLLGYYYFRPASSGSSNVKDPVSYGLLTDINHKLTSMKMEMDDLVNPLMAKINASIEQNHDVSGLDLTEKFVEIAAQYLEAGQRQKAADLYHTITLLYQQLPKEQKAKVHVRCIELSSRLSRAKQS